MAGGTIHDHPFYMYIFIYIYIYIHNQIFHDNPSSYSGSSIYGYPTFRLYRVRPVSKIVGETHGLPTRSAVHHLP